VLERKHKFASFRPKGEIFKSNICVKNQIPHFVRNDTFTTNLIVFVQALIIPLLLISVIVALIGALFSTIIWFERQRGQMSQLEFERLMKRINTIDVKVNDLNIN